MSLLQDWLPPSRENWNLVTQVFQLFPLVTAVQWLIPFYPMGKTSIKSRLNIPGKVAWVIMELPGPLIVLYIMNSLPTQLGLSGLPWENKALAGMYLVHYLNRAIIHPIVTPSMSPMHPFVFIFAALFQACNGISIGCWLGGYGPTSRAEWRNNEMNYKTGGRMELGMMIWALGLLGNILHDDELREIRRVASRRQAEKQKAQDAKTGKGEKRKGVDKIYMIPENYLFKWVLYPHYLCEWIEWGGFWLMGGSHFVPARIFLLNEISTMLPRAYSGKKWYIKKFGKEKIGNRKAAIPGII